MFSGGWGAGCGVWGVWGVWGVGCGVWGVDWFNLSLSSTCRKFYFISGDNGLTSGYILVCILVVVGQLDTGQL